MRKPPLIGTQILPTALIERGIESTLDDMQARARINTILVFSHWYSAYQYAYRAAVDRGQEPDPANHAPLLWVRTDEKYYARTPYRHPGNVRYGGDILDELREPAARRGIAVYPRILEPFMYSNAIPSMKAAVQVDASGRPGDMFCFNHPDYIAWWLAQVEDLVRLHDYVPGFMFGQERGGPFTHMLMGIAPFCFCEHCCRRGAGEGIDVEQARGGMVRLHEMWQGARAGHPPPDGVFATMWRLLSMFPAALAWERMWYRSRDDHQRRIYALLKGIKPAIQVGWHVVHGHAWDVLFRAQIDFAALPEFSDWVKPVMYSDCAGKRAVGFARTCFFRAFFADLDEKTAYRVFLQLMGLGADAEPSLAKIDDGETHALSPDYVYRETRRIVGEVGGRIPVYPGLGFDTCGGEDTPYRNVGPEHVHGIVKQAFAAGADGIFIPREYDEARPEMLSEVGKAVDAVLGI